MSTNLFDNLFVRVERAKQQWEATVDALPELICTVDQKERIIRANRTLERWELGDVTKVAGLDLHSVLHPDCELADCYLDTLLANYRAEESGGERLHQIDVYDRVLGRHLLIHISQIPGNAMAGVAENSRQPAGHEEPPPAWAIIFHDNSKQKRMLQSLQRQANRLRTVNSISRSVLAADSAGAIVNSALEHLQSFLPVHQAAVFLMDSEQSHLEVLAVTDSCDVLKGGTRIALSDLGRISHQRLNQPYYIGDLARLEPQSELEAACERQGIRAYANLPLRVNRRWLGTLLVGTRRAQGFSRGDLGILAEVTELLTVALSQSRLRAQLQETNYELQHTLRAKQESMQDLSHELRTPLALIAGFVELLRSESLGPLTPKQQEALAVVDDRGEHLLTLIERLLLLQTIGNRNRDFEQTDMGTFLRELVNPWRLPANNRGITLELELAASLPDVPVDKALFPQVISNLLDNALKFTPAGGRITVRAWSTPEEIVIEVVDEGTGIAPEQVDAIFERYARGKRSQGAGIGLALCREVVVAHGGTITAASPGEGRGSTFTVRLPYQYPAVTPARAEDSGDYPI